MMWLQRCLSRGSWRSREMTTRSCSLGGHWKVVIKLGVITITNKRGPGQRLGNIPKEEKASIERCEYASWDS